MAIETLFIRDNVLYSLCPTAPNMFDCEDENGREWNEYISDVPACCPAAATYAEGEGIEWWDVPVGRDHNGTCENYDGAL